MNTASVITFDSISQEQLDTITGGIDWDKVNRQGNKSGVGGSIAGAVTGAFTGPGVLAGIALGGGGGYIIGAVGEVGKQLGWWE